MYKRNNEGHAGLIRFHVVLCSKWPSDDSDQGLKEVRVLTNCFPSPQLRPPQPAVYLFVLDVSHNAVEAGYLTVLCQSLLENLDK